MKTMKPLFSTALIAILALSLSACKSSKPTIDMAAKLAYQKDPSAANLENLSKAYGSFINKTRKSGISQPGIYSDYAVTLVKLDRRAEANTWFNKEMQDFPSSRLYVMQLKRLLIPEYQDNNTIVADSAALQQDALSPRSRQAAEERASSVLQPQNNTLDTIKKENEPAPESVPEP
jgi:hypothetical protein